MILTKDEIEAKLAALEDRIALLARVTDNLELRLDEGAEQWDECMSETRNAIICLRRQVDRLRGQAVASSAARAAELE